MPVRSPLIGLALAGCDTEPVDEDTAPAIDAPALFAEHCAECHGDDGDGTSEGPSLYVRTRELSPADVAAVIRFGEDDMPPVEEVTDEQAVALGLWVIETFGP